jgi:hypothetical protein
LPTRSLKIMAPSRGMSRHPSSRSVRSTGAAATPWICFCKADAQRPSMTARHPGRRRPMFAPLAVRHRVIVAFVPVETHQVMAAGALLLRRAMMLGPRLQSTKSRSTTRQWQELVSSRSSPTSSQPFLVLRPRAISHNQFFLRRATSRERVASTMSECVPALAAFKISPAQRKALPAAMAP